MEEIGGMLCEAAGSLAEQRDRVAKLKANGRDAREAERDIELFEDTLAIFEEHLKSVQP
jgi:hypothetical protein